MIAELLYCAYAVFMLFALQCNWLLWGLAMMIGLMGYGLMVNFSITMGYRQ